MGRLPIFHLSGSRLNVFAEKQAKRAQEGWKIEHVEFKPEKMAKLGGAEIHGRIDRIGRKGDEIAVWDYKTGARNYGSKRRCRTIPA